MDQSNAEPRSENGDPIALPGSPFGPDGGPPEVAVGPLPAPPGLPSPPSLPWQPWPVGRLLVTWLIFAVGFNFLTPAVFVGHWPSPWLMLLAATIMLVEPQAIAFWGVFGPRPLLMRWLQMTAVAWMLMVALVLIPVLKDPPLEWFWKEFAAVACLTPLGVLLMPAPLWALRAAGFRLVGVRPGDDEAAQRPQQFTIRDLLALTLVVAVSLGLARCGASLLDGGEIDMSFENGRWLDEGAFLLFLWVLIGMVTVPTVVATLVVRDLAGGIFGLAMYAVGLLLIATFAIVSITGASMSGEATLALVLFIGGSFVLPTVAGAMLRGAGVRLVRRTRRVQAASPFAAPVDQSEPDPFDLRAANAVCVESEGSQPPNEAPHLS